PTAECLEANWSSLRTLGLLITSEVANLLAYTQGLLNWQSNNNFCSVCASKLELKQAGHALICTKMECTKEIFPRTDPAVIVLIYNQDACLLGRAAAWPENMYSCLAGFVETGENLDAAVRREVFEESGLQLKNISYRASQPWPFPQSLMFGFHAESLSRELTFHDGEIQDARWFNRDELLDAVAKGELHLSSSLSISYHLIEDWFNQQSEIALSVLVKNLVQ
ncbi:MAG: NAD+ diphosphatase, partial [Enterobacterales bacterium]